uniref:Uncharacterized protein n=1 Tax=viral metagenome TaxID=1070528 RepID=A0A6M3M8P6_9ZZZZ
MFDEVKPESEAFDVLQQFCFKIAEGCLEPQRMIEYYYRLPHPVVDGDYLIIQYDKAFKRFYIKELVEGGLLEEMPVVHAFSFGRGDWLDKIFPQLVDVHDNPDLAITPRAIYHLYDFDIRSIEVPLPQYKRLKLLFDGENPAPWNERINPVGPPLPGDFPEANPRTIKRD